ncbi:MAG: N-acetylglucosamine kinase [Promicromonosporaceae bacterium]|nr:N-acetylglucosamine kinase [Promicromonosporaceae bacterium]
MGEVISPAEPGVIVAIDGGGTKTDIAVLSRAGEVLARQRVGRYYPQEIGAHAVVSALDGYVTGLLETLGSPPVLVAAIFFSGLDFEFEIEAFRAELAWTTWAGDADSVPAGVAPPVVLVDNDLFAVLRAGTDSPDAVAVICGTGANAIGLAADGSKARFAALGEISGDWGGGASLGMSAVWHSARAEDGRGPTTLLRDLVLEQLGFGSMAALIEAAHLGKVDWDVFSTLAPTVFVAADAGDEVAIGLVLRQADEIVAFAAAAMKRLGITDRVVPVVLAGGVVAANHPLLTGAISERLAEVAPRAFVSVLSAPPLVGAAMLALDAVGADAVAHETAALALS